MKFSFLLFSFLFILSMALKSQDATDTLVIGNYKFPLSRTKTHYDAYQRGIVQLPSEYSDTKHEVEIPYKYFSDSVATMEFDNKGYQYWILKPEKRVQEPDPHIYLPYFLDTINIKAENLEKLKPYIKQKTGKVYFTGVRLLSKVDTTISEYYTGNFHTGELFSVLGFSDDFKNLKRSYLIVTDLYYRKGNATYYFNRNLIILVL